MLGKALTTAAAGNAAGAGEATYVEDVFSTYLYTGNGSGQVIENGIALGTANSGGSAGFNGTSGSCARVDGNSAYNLSGNDWTVEYFFYTNDAGTTQIHVDNSATGQYNSTMEFEVFNNTNGSASLVVNGTIPITSSAGVIQSSTWHHIAISTVSGTSTLYVDGTSIGTTTTLPDANTYHWEIGDRPANAGSGNYPVDGNISNFRMVVGTGIYTTSFTPPSAPLGVVANTQILCLQGDDPFVDNSGNSRTISLSGAGVKAKAFGPFTSDTEGKGGLVWCKARNYGDRHCLFDTERGATKRLSSNLTNVEFADVNSLTSFNSNGFTLGSSALPNRSTYDHASWTFRKAPKFFDVVTYTGDGIAGKQIAHNLGSVPGVIIVKGTDIARDWWVFHRSTGETNKISLNDTNGAVAQTGAWNDTAPTSTHFTVGNSLQTNGDTYNYVAYVFAHNDGDGEFGEDADQDIIKCGSYTGTGAVGNFVDVGFEPQWVLIKSASATANWYLFDNMRGINTGSNDTVLWADDSRADFSSNRLALDPTGFTLTNASNTNTNAHNYIYIAIRRGPMKTPESGTEVFAQDYRHNATPAYTSNFPVDWSFQKRETGTATTVRTRLLGTNYLEADSNAVQATLSTITWDHMEGMESHTSDQTDKWMWMFRRAPGFFDVVAYTGNNTARTISHNLGVVPEMIWVKNREQASDWIVYNKDLNGGTTPEDYHLHLNLTSSEATNTIYFNSTAPTSTVFSIGADGDVNNNTRGYIAYLFATLPGVSKVGSYDGSGGSNTQVIDCGFSAGARFVLLKRYNASGYDWQLFDTERGITSGNDAKLSLNNTSAESTANWGINPNSSGFEVTGNGLNETGGSWIFLAIA